jgi:hypothetical protein
VSYAIEFTTNLASNVWTPLFNGLGGTGNVLSVVSPGQGTRATLFYRCASAMW